MHMGLHSSGASLSLLRLSLENMTMTMLIVIASLCLFLDGFPEGWIIPKANLPIQFHTKCLRLYRLDRLNRSYNLYCRSCLSWKLRFSLKKEVSPIEGHWQSFQTSGSEWWTKGQKKPFCYIAKHPPLSPPPPPLQVLKFSFRDARGNCAI